jgi:hypothetical protein
MKIKIKIKGKSLNKLYKEYGTGSSGFYSINPWWKDQKFADEKPKAGEYEIDFAEELINLTFEEKEKEITEGFEIIHPAIVAEAILSHFKATGERILENRYVHTSSLDSDGHRVLVGGFDETGLLISSWDGGHRSSGIGVASARKLNLKPSSLETFDSLTLDSAIKMVKEAGYQVSKIM